MNITEKMDTRLFRDADVIAVLEAMSTEAITLRYGPPRLATVYSRKVPPPDKPALATDDPAVAQAMGRCAVSRMRQEGFTLPSHDPCGFCDYPVKELVTGCEWAEWRSRYVIAEVMVWRSEHGSYEREGAGPHYQNPVWRDFWALPIVVREQQIMEAAS